LSPATRPQLTKYPYPDCNPTTQVMLNPFHTSCTKIVTKSFDGKVRQLAKRTLG